MAYDDDGLDDYIEAERLTPEESLDEDELGADLEDGYSPNERPWGITSWGTTAAEEASGEDLAHRLRREEPDVDAAEYGDGLGDSSDTDGELIDDEVGDARAGRLVFGSLDRADPASDFLAADVGVDGGGASAEEAAVHVVPDLDGPAGLDGEDF